MRKRRWKAWFGLGAFAVSFVLAACTVGPDYVPSSAPVPSAYKELKGWKRAAPADDCDRGAWWSLFKDQRLDSLEREVELSNQNIAAAEAAYRQSLAIIKEGQAGLFPTVNANYSVIREHFGAKAFGFGGGASSVASSAALGATGSAITTTISTLSTSASWDLDLWGKIRRMVESDVAASQVSAADLANAKLSAQAMLATAYYNLRSADALQALLYRDVAAFKQTLQITQHQYEAGTVSKADVATAQAQVFSTESQAINVGVMRAQFEHAIAALMGKPPADLSIPTIPLPYKLPDVPVGVPSALLERRPDIAGAERAMQQQNALIGAAIALYYPDVTLSGMFGFMGKGALALSLANEVWSISASAVQPAFDAGLRDAQVEAALSVYKQSVATYRQTVLTGFQQVEDQLAAVRILARQERVAEAAVKASQEEVDIILNQYRAGTVNFTAVNVAQETLLTNQQAALAVRQSRFVATVSLIEAVGGGWDTGLLPTAHALETRNPLIPVQ
ncbi:MAG: efflux transporter outer membrane subunit [Methylocapsa sp.]|nr:efflux transporter outer membrane subunit [Methylocapsa sp.]